MNNKLLAAWTPPTPNNGDYVPFVNFSKLSDGTVCLSVRKGGRTAEQLSVILPYADFETLVSDLNKAQ